LVAHFFGDKRLQEREKRMPRRNDIAKKLLGPLSVVFLLSTVVCAQQTFEEYLTGLKAHRPGSDVIQMAGSCGIRINEMKPQYAIRTDEHWVSRDSLLIVDQEAQTDLFDTAQIWNSRDGGSLAVLWYIAADIAEESELILCVSPHGYVVSLLNQTTEIPVDGSKGWTYREQVDFLPDGRHSKRTAGFVNEKGDPSAPPVLEAETKNNLLKPANAKQALAALNAVNKSLGVRK
jgi:hypothetical protein